MIRIARHLTTLVPLLGLAIGGSALAREPAAQDLKHPALLDFRSCAKPQYPQDELRAGHEGTVTVMFQIDGEGKVNDSKVSGSSGFPALDEAARSALASCRFQPAIGLDGQPVAAWTPVQYVWSSK